MIVMLELHDPHPDTDSARAEFTRIGVPSSPILAQLVDDGAGQRYFAVFRVQAPIHDCRFLVLHGDPVAMVHGTDCAMVRGIAKDMRHGEQSPFRYCPRRLAGGAFKSVDITRLRRSA